MVLVNFNVAMGADGASGIWAIVAEMTQGRAAALFVVLAGIGLGLAYQRHNSAKSRSAEVRVIYRRASFLLILGLINMTIFEPDILHYYAFYFALSPILLAMSNTRLLLVSIAISSAFVMYVITGDFALYGVSLGYETGWDWQSLTYTNLWTIPGFLRNLWLNGWHPVIPWLTFLIVGIFLSRCQIDSPSSQNRLIAVGAACWGGAELVSQLLQRCFLQGQPELASLLTTNPIPPMTLYLLAALGFSSFIIGACLRSQQHLINLGLAAIFAPAGRQTLTLYIAHIVIGMGALEAFDLLDGSSAATAALAAGSFVLLATLFSMGWARFFPRGPIETLMRRIAG